MALPGHKHMFHPQPLSMPGREQPKGGNIRAMFIGIFFHLVCPVRELKLWSVPLDAVKIRLNYYCFFYLGAGK